MNIVGVHYETRLGNECSCSPTTTTMSFSLSRWRRVRFHSCLEQRDIFLFSLVLSLFEISSRNGREAQLYFCFTWTIFWYLLSSSSGERENGKNCYSILLCSLSHIVLGHTGAMASAEKPSGLFSSSRRRRRREYTAAASRHDILFLFRTSESICQVNDIVY